MNFKLNAMRHQWNTLSNSQDQENEESFNELERDSMFVSLPPEVLNAIAQYLTVQDLLSCSASCTRLRDVFNDNMIWRKFCKQNIIGYMNRTVRKLQLDYDIDSLPFSFLDPICDERILYMQQNQLLRNWKNGKFTEHEIHSMNGLYYPSLKSGTPIIYDDIYLFLYDFFRHKIVIWDIEDSPEPYTSIRLLYQNYYYEGLHYEVSGKKLVVLEVGKFVQIYDINLPDKTLPLISVIIVDKEEPLGKVPEIQNPEEMYICCYHKIFGNKIYSHKIGKAILHIWDIDSGKKDKTFHPPKEGINFDVLNATNSGNDLVVCLEINDHERQHTALGKIYDVFTYSFSQDVFRTIWTNKDTFSTTFVPIHAIQHEDFVILFCRLHDFFIEDPSLPKTLVIIYNCKWDIIIGEKTFPELVCHRQMRIINNQLLLATAFCIYILDLKTQDVTYCFKFENGKIELLNVFDGNFIITTPKSPVSVSKTKKKEVWDIHNRNKCLQVMYVYLSGYSNDSVFVNESFTKMVVVGKGTLGVLNFW